MYIKIEVKSRLCGGPRTRSKGLMGSFVKFNLVIKIIKNTKWCLVELLNLYKNRGEIPHARGLNSLIYIKIEVKSRMRGG